MRRFSGLSFVGAIVIATGLAWGDSRQAPGYWLTAAQSDVQQVLDPAERSGVLAAIARQWTTLGQPDKAKEAASQAMPIAQNIQDPHAQFQIYNELADL